ncbi:NAD(P)-dependent dehydrogenase (short-subunit alcohol dehydrogenase family) [Halarchaeum rubridurum]|uniref:Beta-ketoacyl-ACP reductase n=1 Tax=Halarchaeum rubridurum TaxID=489911 RepID=A0A830FT24_9EURY|nr:SDR family NAD(P)-dependent oxidoreductase [Halarchaeum rubridurum]MBP1955245.1 NAD(P)-dependent dehydrogenase (short-subunit alcohol dehydrogenase family) [Halarchaeum rubridurum]GGM67865.1 beta-ketoacyl-ACP reductase [Halarchaeum rubridurum]
MGRLSYDFDGETVIVTGGSSGIGRAVAARFGEAGATVVVADVDEEPRDVDAIVPTAQRIRDAGGEAHFVETDVSDPDDVESVVAAAREFGGVDVMVNNAGISRQAPFLDIDPDDLDALYEVNVKGVFVGTQAAGRDMVERDDPGCIVNTASISSEVSQFGQSAYDVSKAAVQMATRGAALELGEHGVRVNAVAPGHIGTEITEGWTEEARSYDRESDLLKPLPLGRAGTPEDVAGAFCWLASEDAAYVTGETVTVDGGWLVT